MKSITHSNGVVSNYDETLQPGDLISAYRSGFHEFIKFKDRGANCTPLCVYATKFDSKRQTNIGKITKSA